MDARELPMPVTDVAAVANAPIMRRLYDAAFTANQVMKGF